MESKIKILRAKNNATFARITTLYDSSKKLSPSSAELRSIEAFMADSETIDTLRQEYVQNLDLINEFEIKQKPEFEPDYQALMAFEEVFTRLKRCRVRLGETSHASSSPRSESVAKTTIKLPPINIYSFDGKMENWPVFYESFKANIHCNADLTDSQRIQYLLGKLTGNALKITAGVIPSGENYNSIWNNLVKKYQDKRALGSYYVSTLLNIKTATSNAASLNNFIESFDSATAALRLLKLDDLHDFILLNLALRKVDTNTAQAFEMSVRDKDIPSYGDFVEFIKSQVKILDRTNNNNSLNQSASNSKNYNNRPRNTVHSFVTRNDNNTACSMCNKSDHYQLYSCSTFKSMSPKDRFEFIKSKRGCINCLSITHTASNCNSRYKCKVCNKRHHSLLHLDKNLINYVTAATSVGRNTTHIERNETDGVPGHGGAPHELRPPSLHATACSAPVSLCARDSLAYISHDTASVCAELRKEVLLSTASVYARNEDKNILCTVRCLIDNASQNNLITTQCCKQLNLDIIPLTNSFIKGVGLTSRPIKGYVTLVISAKNNTQSYKITALVVDCITDRLPVEYVDTSVIRHLVNIPLADPLWHVPGEVNIILGAKLFPFILLGGRIIVPSAPCAIETAFGYILMGEIPSNTETVSDRDRSALKYTSFASFLTCVENDVHDSLSKFWELEEIPFKKLLSSAEIECEQIYTSTVTRDSSGRYCTALPFCKEPNTLGNSRAVAYRRLLALERKLQDPKLRAAYNAVIKEYIDCQYLYPVPPQLDNFDEGYFIPHHPVIREDKLSSKVRIVLDASTQCHNDVSLNDILHAGPNLQADLFLLLLNFRLFPVAITADIKQMYLQILVTDEHQRYQKKNVPV